MIRRHLTYANVTATLALVLAAGTGAVYAAGEIGSRDLANNSVRTQDLKDRRGVTGEDLKGDTLGSREIDESGLIGTRLLAMEGEQTADCDPQQGVFGDCASVTLDLDSPSILLVVVTGGFSSEGGPAIAECQVRIDGVAASGSDNPGETTDNTSIGATDGFARTLITDQLEAGSHDVSMACQQVGAADARVRSPSIAVLGVKSAKD